MFVENSSFIFCASDGTNSSILYFSLSSGFVISRYFLVFFVRLIELSEVLSFSRKFTIFEKISPAPVAQLTHFILLASLFPTHTQII
ncbi:TPA: hypothetical protein DEG21_01840 [Patescibacteria group bacterium]|nr:hypothetical protein [Candidatus Gracilibacteria bacterium]HBY74629.1 hypothetical protein [Candidatus Gracilibacteria bacterium]